MSVDEHKHQRSPGHVSEGPPRSVKELYEEAAQNEQILRRYQQFELKILSAGSFEALLHTLLHTSIEMLRLDAVELWLHDPQDVLGEMIPEAFLEHRDLQLLKHERIFERLYQDPLDVRLASIQKTNPLPVFKGRTLRSAAMLPLHRNGTFVGSIHFGAKGDRRFTADKSTDFMAHLASILAVCIENAVSQEHLRRLSMLDMLTRVNNRRGFHIALDREVSRAARSGDPLCLLFIDLDHFKAINDTYGHPMGDKVLRAVAQLLRDTLRRVDHVCRYGGEEFALVLPSCGRELAMDIAERLRQRVSQLQVELEDESGERGDAISVTLSMGVCCWQPDRRIDDRDEQKIATELIARSDQGVYESKANGRNTVRYVGFETS
ncbi:MAG: GGDEF domain-containing protein [Congregibacter sp.]